MSLATTLSLIVYYHDYCDKSLAWGPNIPLAPKQFSQDVSCIFRLQKNSTRHSEKKVSNNTRALLKKFRL